MAQRFLMLIPILVIIPDMYIWFTRLVEVKSRWKFLHWLPLLATIAVGVGLVASDRNSGFMYAMMLLVIAVSIPKIIYTAVSIPFKIASILSRSLSRIGDIIAAICGVLTFCFMIYGLTYGWRQITVKNVTVSSDRLPQSFDGYRIVQISDLHLGTFENRRSFIHDVVAAVNKQKADMVCFTGDIVNFYSKELDAFIPALSKIKAPDGVYSIMGNHDYCEYHKFESPEGSIHNAELLIQMERSMGWHMLLNSHRYVVHGSDSIAVVGVENNGEPPFKSYSNLPKAIRGVSADKYQLLLSHNPVHWRKEVLGGSNADLMLAGHTHAMQFRIGRFSPSALRYKEWGGLYKEGNRALYVNTGTGGNFLFRFGAWPEITVITLRKSVEK